MKKYILPLIAVLFLSAAVNAQTSKKTTPMKAVATGSTNKATIGKKVSSADTTKPKSKTTMPATTTKKKHHKKGKKAAPKTSGK